MPLPIELLPPAESDSINQARRAAEAHRRARYNIQNVIKPGMSLNEIVNIIETSTRILLKGERCDGIGFPTGVSLNDCAAHYTTNPGDKERILREDDVLKIDFGSHCDGRIMDSAFTICFDPIYEPLLAAAQAGTEKGLKECGVDVRVCDIGAEIEEIVSSYELDLTSKSNYILPNVSKKIKSIRNLNGHSIGQYLIHAGITIPIIRNNDPTRLTDETFYAFETFATTGEGYVINADNCSHYSFNGSLRKNARSPNTIKILDHVVKKIGTLPFCPRYLESIVPNCKPYVDILAKLNIFETYPPLMDSANSVVSQFEHTVYLGRNGKEILTRGDDY